VMPSPMATGHAVESGDDMMSAAAVPRQDPYWESIRIMQTTDLFMEGMLLRSVDCKRKTQRQYLVLIR